MSIFEYLHILAGSCRNFFALSVTFIPQFSGLLGFVSKDLLQHPVTNFKSIWHSIFVFTLLFLSHSTVSLYLFVSFFQLCSISIIFFSLNLSLMHCSLGFYACPIPCFLLLPSFLCIKMKKTCKSLL